MVRLWGLDVRRTGDTLSPGLERAGRWNAQDESPLGESMWGRA